MLTFTAVFVACVIVDLPAASNLEAASKPKRDKLDDTFVNSYAGEEKDYEKALKKAEAEAEGNEKWLEDRKGARAPRADAAAPQAEDEEDRKLDKLDDKLTHWAESMESDAEDQEREAKAQRSKRRDLEDDLRAAKAAEREEQEAEREDAAERDEQRAVDASLAETGGIDDAKVVEHAETFHETDLDREAEKELSLEGKDPHVLTNYLEGKGVDSGKKDQWPKDLDFENEWKRDIDPLDKKVKDDAVQLLSYAMSPGTGAAAAAAAAVGISGSVAGPGGGMSALNAMMGIRQKTAGQLGASAKLGANMQNRLAQLQGLSNQGTSEMGKAGENLIGGADTLGQDSMAGVDKAIQAGSGIGNGMMGEGGAVAASIGSGSNELGNAADEAKKGVATMFKDMGGTMSQVGTQMETAPGMGDPPPDGSAPAPAPGFIELRAEVTHRPRRARGELVVPESMVDPPPSKQGEQELGKDDPRIAEMAQHFNVWQDKIIDKLNNLDLDKKDSMFSELKEMKKRDAEFEKKMAKVSAMDPLHTPHHSRHHAHTSKPKHTHALQNEHSGKAHAATKHEAPVHHRHNRHATSLAQASERDVPIDPVEAKLAQLQDKMQAQTRAFEAAAKHDALVEEGAVGASFAQVGSRSGPKKDIPVHEHTDPTQDSHEHEPAATAAEDVDAQFDEGIPVDNADPEAPMEHERQEEEDRRAKAEGDDEKDKNFEDPTADGGAWEKEDEAERGKPDAPSGSAASLLQGDNGTGDDIDGKDPLLEHPPGNEAEGLGTSESTWDNSPPPDPEDMPDDVPDPDAPAPQTDDPVSLLQTSDDSDDDTDAAITAKYGKPLDLDLHPRVKPPVLPNVLAEMPTLQAEGNMERLMFNQDVAGQIDPASTADQEPTSFAQISENPDDGFAKVEAKLKALQEKIKADTAKFEQEAKAAPSSFAEVSTEDKAKAARNKVKDAQDKFDQVFRGLQSFEEQLVQDNAERKHRLATDYVRAAASSLLQELDEPSPSNDPKVKELEAKFQKDLDSFNAQTAAIPASLLQEWDKATSPEDGFAKVEAKLKALQEKIKADTAKFEQEAKAAPSSFAQTSENPDDTFAKVEAKLKALQEKIKTDTAKFEQEAKAAPSSLLQRDSPGFEAELARQQAQANEMHQLFGATDGTADGATANRATGATPEKAAEDPKKLSDKEKMQKWLHTDVAAVMQKELEQATALHDRLSALNGRLKKRDRQLTNEAHDEDLRREHEAESFLETPDAGAGEKDADKDAKDDKDAKGAKGGQDAATAEDEPNDSADALRRAKRDAEALFGFKPSDGSLLQSSFLETPKPSAKEQFTELLARMRESVHEMREHANEFKEGKGISSLLQTAEKSAEDKASDDRWAKVGSGFDRLERELRQNKQHWGRSLDIPASLAEIRRQSAHYRHLKAQLSAQQASLPAATSLLQSNQGGTAADRKARDELRAFEQSMAAQFAALPASAKAKQQPSLLETHRYDGDKAEQEDRIDEMKGFEDGGKVDLTAIARSPQEQLRKEIQDAQYSPFD